MFTACCGAELCNSTRNCLCARSARIAVRAGLPGRLDDAWDLALERQRAEAQTAYAELAEERARTAAELAAVMLAALELGLAGVFHSLCCCCHGVSLSLVKLNSSVQNLLSSRRGEGHPEGLQPSAGVFVRLCRRHDGDVHTLGLVDLRVVDLGEEQ